MANKTEVNLTTTTAAQNLYIKNYKKLPKEICNSSTWDGELRQVGCEFYDIVSSRLGWAIRTKPCHNLTSQEIKVEHTQRKK